MEPTGHAQIISLAAFRGLLNKTLKLHEDDQQPIECVIIAPVVVFDVSIRSDARRPENGADVVVEPIKD